jgi:stalled ribosome rescue protein Dom34
VKRKQRYRRGYPVAVLVGFEEDHAMIWHVFSRVIKPFQKIHVDGRRAEEKVLYNFHQSVVDAIKPTLNEGVHSVVVASPPRTTYSEVFLNHVNKHHKYLVHSKGANRANFVEINGSADNKLSVSELITTTKFTELIAETTTQEAGQAVSLLEKYLYNADNNSVLYSLTEIEKKVYQKDPNNELSTEYLLLTNKYLNESKQKSRIQRLMQISRNKKIKTKVVDAETAAGSRINQFGGIVYFAVPVRQNSG